MTDPGLAPMADAWRIAARMYAGTSTADTFIGLPAGLGCLAFTIWCSGRCTEACTKAPCLKAFGAFGASAAPVCTKCTEQHKTRFGAFGALRLIPWWKFKREVRRAADQIPGPQQGAHRVTWRVARHPEVAAGFANRCFIPAGFADAVPALEFGK